MTKLSERLKELKFNLDSINELELFEQGIMDEAISLAQRVEQAGAVEERHGAEDVPEWATTRKAISEYRNLCHDQFTALLARDYVKRPTYQEIYKVVSEVKQTGMIKEWKLGHEWCDLIAQAVLKMMEA